MITDAYTTAVLAAAGEPTQGPLCAAWRGSPDPDGCEHSSCYAIAWRDTPPHDCPIEADHADPISIEYGVFLATCAVCAAYQRADDERAWEDRTERTNR